VAPRSAEQTRRHRPFIQGLNEAGIVTIYLSYPYDDETFPSVVTRYCDTTKVGDRNALEERLTGTVNLPAAGIARGNLLAQQTWDAWGWSGEELVSRFSLFPLYASFFTKESGRKLLAKMLTYGENGVSHIKAINGLRYCPQCFAEDRSSGRQEYWRRSHQIQGIVFCHKHCTPLCEIGVSRNVASKFSPSRRGELGRVLELKMSSIQVEHAVAVAKRCYAVLSSPSFVDRVSEAKHWREIALALPQLKKGNRVRLAELKCVLLDFYGESYTAQVCDAIKQSSTKRDDLLRKAMTEPYGISPIAFIHLQQFFEQLERDLPGAPSIRQPLNHKPYCPNRFAQHGPNHRVKIVSPKSGSVRRTAACDCGVWFSFDGIKEGHPTGVKIRIAGAEFRRKALELVQSGVGTTAVARKLGLSITCINQWRRGEIAGKDDQLVKRICNIETRLEEAIQIHGTLRSALREDVVLARVVRRYAPHLLPKKISARATRICVRSARKDVRKALEQAVLAVSMERPELGKSRAAHEVSRRYGLEISNDMVRNVWTRFDIGTTEKRQMRRKNMRSGQEEQPPGVIGNISILRHRKQTKSVV
jgi:TniQ